MAKVTSKRSFVAFKGKTTAKKTTKPAVKTAPKAVKKATAKTIYKLGIGDMAPKFSLPDGTRPKGSVVLYFYPKDHTSGCTTEGLDFKKLHSAFKKMDCEIFGVSRDSLKSHASFGEKHGFPFGLLSDEKSDLCKAFDVIQMKSLYGRKFEGIERSTFVIGKNGKILAEWRKVKVDGHAKAVHDFVKEMNT